MSANIFPRFSRENDLLYICTLLELSGYVSKNKVPSVAELATLACNTFCELGSQEITTALQQNFIIVAEDVLDAFHVMLEKVESQEENK